MTKQKKKYITLQIQKNWTPKNEKIMFFPDILLPQCKKAMYKIKRKS